MKIRVAAPPAADPHAGAPLQVRNEVRKKKLLAKQEKTLEQQLAALQQEIDDLVGPTVLIAFVLAYRYLFSSGRNWKP